MNLHQIITDIKKGYTVGEVKRIHNITDEECYALFWYRGNLSLAEIVERIIKIEVGMKADEIKRIMQSES